MAISNNPKTTSSDTTSQWTLALHSQQSCGWFGHARHRLRMPEEFAGSKGSFLLKIHSFDSSRFERSCWNRNACWFEAPRSLGWCSPFIYDGFVDYQFGYLRVLNKSVREHDLNVRTWKHWWLYRMSLLVNFTPAECDLCPRKSWSWTKIRNPCWSFCSRTRIGLGGRVVTCYVMLYCHKHSELYVYNSICCGFFFKFISSHDCRIPTYSRFSSSDGWERRSPLRLWATTSQTKCWPFQVIHPKISWILHWIRPTILHIYTFTWGGHSIRWHS